MNVSMETLPKTISAFHDRYRGRPAAILGGGPSLPTDVLKLPPNCVLIAVNYHALRLCAPDFMVYNDQPESDPALYQAVLAAPAMGITRVSPDPSSDVQFNMSVWTGFYSSNTAAWFALWCGCDPVILCGMDCYQGEKKYFHPYEHHVPVFDYPLEHHLRPWIEEARAFCVHPERLRAMSGPLMNVFGRYQEAR